MGIPYFVIRLHCKVSVGYIVRFLAAVLLAVRTELLSSALLTLLGLVGYARAGEGWCSTRCEPDGVWPD